MHFLIKIIVNIGSIAIAALAGGIALLGCASPGTPVNFVDTAKLTEVRNAAPFLTCLVLDGPMYVEDGVTKFDLDQKQTGTILPNGEILTAGHFLHVPTVNGQRITFIIEGRRADATVLDHYISSDRRKDYLRMAVDLPKPPNLVTQRLEAHERKLIRFEGGFNLHKGQTVYAVGFLGQGSLSPPLFGLELKVVPLKAAEGGSSGPLVLDHPTDVNLFGMSGGPIIACDQETGQLVVVGIVIHSESTSRFGKRLLFGCRLQDQSGNEVAR